MSKRDELIRTIMQGTPEDRLQRNAQVLARVLQHSRPVPNSTADERLAYLATIQADAAPPQPVYQPSPAPPETLVYQYSMAPSAEHLRASQEAVRFAMKDLRITQAPTVRWFTLATKSRWPAEPKNGFTSQQGIAGLARFAGNSISLNADLTVDQVPGIVLHEAHHLHQRLRAAYETQIDQSETLTEGYAYEALGRYQRWQRGDLTAFNRRRD